MSFAKIMGTKLSCKYGQKLFNSAKKSAADAIKAASKRVIQKTAEATGDLNGNKIADKIMSVSKKSKNNEDNDESETGTVSPKDVPKERYISPKKRQQTIHELRLV